MDRMVFDSLLVWQCGDITALESEAYCREFDIRIGGLFFLSYFSFLSNNRHFLCKCNGTCDTTALKPCQIFSLLEAF